MTARADEIVVASFPSRAAAALAAGALRASGIASWSEAEDGAGHRFLLVVRTQAARAAREVLAAHPITSPS